MIKLYYREERDFQKHYASMFFSFLFYKNIQIYPEKKIKIFSKSCCKNDPYLCINRIYDKRIQYREELYKCELLHLWGFSVLFYFNKFKGGKYYALIIKKHIT